MSQSSVSIMSAKTWELTPYELQRTPQEVVTDNTEIAVSPRSLHSELMCPICLDMLRTTMTTKECLHRFCQECITTALRSGNKECPTCRKKLVSRRSLRPDPNFDALISKIYPSRDEYEEHQQKVLERITKHHNNAGFANAIEEGLKEQDKMRNVKTKKSELANLRPTTNGTPVKNENSAPNSKTTTPEKTNGKDVDKEETSKQKGCPSSSSANERVSNTANNKDTDSSDLPYPPKRKKFSHPTKEEPSSSSRNKDVPSTHDDTKNDSEASTSSTSSQNSMELQLHPHPQHTKQQQIRNIKTSVVATMHHVSHFLTLRNMLESGESKTNAIPNMKETQPEFTLYVKSPNEKFIAVGYEESLETLLQKYWRDSNKVQLFYLKKK